MWVFWKKFFLFIQGPKFCDNYEQFKLYTLYLIYTQCARDGSDILTAKLKIVNVTRSFTCTCMTLICNPICNTWFEEITSYIEIKSYMISLNARAIERKLILREMVDIKDRKWRQWENNDPWVSQLHISTIYDDKYF